MPSPPRHDEPGAVQNATLKGAKESHFLLDEEDQVLFARDLRKVIGETGTTCLARAQMGNHVHLLFKTGRVPLWKVMHRIATRVAMRFNRKYEQKGHVLDGPFWSRRVEEEIYLLEAIRYILLNPLRAGIVSSLDELAAFPWTTYSALLDRCLPYGEAVDLVLGLFRGDPDESRRHLTEFLTAGLSEDPEIRAPFARLGILGTEKFARRVLEAADDPVLRRAAAELNGRSLEMLTEEVCRLLGASPAMVRNGRRSKPTSQARALIAHFASRDLGLTERQIAHAVGTGRSAIGRCADRGDALVDRFGIRFDAERILIRPE